MKSSQIVLASRPIGFPNKDNFRFESIVLENLKPGEILIKSIFISVDPYMRGRMNSVKSYAVPYEVNQPIRGGVVGKVVESRSKAFSTGDIITGTLPWATYIVDTGINLRKVDPSSAPPSYSLGLLGMPGLTAYFGVMDIGKPKAGETAVVSGAGGAVGLVAGQIAKILGARVIGIAGSDEKCSMLKEQFGFDDTINYKTSKIMKKSVARACPDGVDFYFDNVGGEITDGVIVNLNFHSRIALCGQIAYYNNVEFPVGPRIMPRLLTRSILLQGFIVSNYSSRFTEGLDHLTSWLHEGKLKYTETIIKGFDNLPDAFLGLFSGKNQGKMLVEI